MEDDLRHLAPVEPSRPAAGGTVQIMKGAGGRHLAVAFREDLRQHELLQEGMEEVLSFVAEPGVEGISPLTAWQRATAVFAYPIDEGRVLADLVRDPSPQPRAALELIARLAPILEAAAQRARPHGLYAHGALGPHRIVVTNDGGVRVVGYGLPPVDVLAWLDEQTDVEPFDLALSPPERIEDKGEDLRSDLFSLGVIAARMATGAALLEGSAADLADAQVAGAMADAVRRFEPALGRPVVDLLGALLARKIADRPRATEGLSATATQLAGQIKGVRLAHLQLGLPDDDDDATAVVAPRPARPARATRTPPPPDPQPLPNDGLTPMPLEANPVAETLARLPDPSKSRAPEATGLTKRPLASTPPAAAPTDEGELPAPVPELPGHAPLEVVKQHGRDVVARAQALADLARTEVQRLAERAAEHPGLAGEAYRAGRQHADRANKAAASAAAAARLLELDEDAAGALITLDLVRNGEHQAMQSTREVKNLLAETERAVDRQRIAAQQRAEAVRKAKESAVRAADLANQADELVTALEDEARRGDLSAEGVADVVEEAIAAAARSHAASEDAAAHADEAQHAERAEVAHRHADAADRSEQAAQEGLQGARDAAERARKLEAEGRQTAVRRAREHAETASGCLQEANGALARADEALDLVGSSEARDLRNRCERQVDAVRRASQEADQARRRAEDASQTRVAAEQAALASRAVGTAREALEEARTLSDQVVRMAGDAAERRAALSKAHTEASSLAEAAARVANKAREDIARLLEDTRGVSGTRTVALRAEALEFVQSAERYAKRAAEEAEAVRANQRLDEAQARLVDLKEVLEKARTAAGRSSERGAEARDHAERELAELRRQEQAREAAKAAAAEARRHADDCRAAVAAAWERAKAVAAVIDAHPLDAAVRLRKKAVEIIDIAEFQSGEAQTSAQSAERESDPAEARAHAQTAESFSERIRLDLPEAIHALDEAEALVRKETADREHAKQHTEEVQASVQALARAIRRALDDHREEAAQWSNDPDVAAAYRELGELAEIMAEDLTESGWARDRAAQVPTASEALAMIPVADAALQRAKEKDRRAEALRELFHRSLQAAQSAAQAMDDARKGLAAALQATTDALASVLAGSRRLEEAIATHAAIDAPSQDARLRLRESASRIRDLARRLTTFEQELEAGTLSAGAAIDNARGAVQTVEIELEASAEAETAGVAAAEEEARRRAEATQRRLEASREEADHQVHRVEKAVRRVDETLDDAEEAAEKARSQEARDAFAHALDLGEQLRALVGEVEDMARRVAVSHDADEAESNAGQARGLADRLLARAEEIARAVQDAHDLARSAEAEAEALAQVKAEVQAAVERADDEVARAKAEAKRILGILREAPRDEVRAVAETASAHIQTASQAAAKVRAAAPLAAAADALPVAQNILRTSRLALERAKTAADAVQALVGESLERVKTQKEERARALAETRAAATAPVREAVAEARKADSWLEAGKRIREEHPGDAEIGSLWAELQAHAERLASHAEAAQDAAAPIAAAPTLEAVQRLHDEVARLADQARVATESARDALQRMRDLAARREAEKSERAAAMEGVRQEIQEHVDTARLIAEQSETSLRELLQQLAAHDTHRDTLSRFTDAARQGTERARAAAEQARDLQQSSRDAANVEVLEDAADACLAAVQVAMDALERVAVCETAFREKLAKLLMAADDEARRRDAEAKRAAAVEQARLADEEATREARMAERRERFRQRQEDRSGSTAALDADSLRERLRRPPPGTEEDIVTARDENAEPPRPRIRRRSAAPEPDANHTRSVRSWTPNESQPVPDGLTSAQPRRAARPRAQRPDNPNETKADALLERLRRNRGE